MPGQFGVICPELLEILPLIRVRRSFKDSHKGPARLRLELEARDRLNGPPVHNGHSFIGRRILIDPGWIFSSPESLAPSEQISGGAHVLRHEAARNKI